MTKLYKPLLTPLGLTYPQYLVLLVLWAEDAQSVSALGEQLSLDSGTLTPLLKRMEHAGFIARARDPSDERRVVVRLSAQGQLLRQRASNIPAQLACAASCSLEELGILTRRLHELRAQLTQVTPSVDEVDTTSKRKPHGPRQSSLHRPR
jgi:DNA-binding MarR family transcriptional regulator